MTRATYVIRDGKLIEKHLAQPLGHIGGGSSNSPAVLGDIDDFRSPIDGSIVRGRAGIREHCKRHDVVPTAELKGLPTSLSFDVNSREQREARRENIARQLYRK